MRKRQNTVADGQIVLAGFFDTAPPEEIQKVSVTPVVAIVPTLFNLQPETSLEEKNKPPEETSSAIVLAEYYPAMPIPAATGNDERIERNIAALKAMDTAKTSITSAAAGIQETIAAYTGWENTFQSNQEKEALAKKLEAEFTQETACSLLAAPQYPYSPQPWAAQTIYSALTSMGFSGGSILCVGGGNGALLREMPSEMRAKCRISAEATDRVNQDLFGLLYPSVKTYQPQEEIPTSFFDAVVGIIPVSPDDMPVLTFKGQKASFERYAYHMAKALCVLRTGGILAMLIPSKTTDSMARKNSPFELSATPLFFASGLRLDLDAMENSQSYDLLCFQKRERTGSEKNEVFALDKILVPRMTPSKQGDMANLFLPSYFSWHPETVIGEYLYSDGKTYPSGFVVVPPSEADRCKAIADAIDSWCCKGVYTSISADSESEDGGVLPADPSVKNYGMVAIGGIVWQRLDSAMIQQKLSGIRLERVLGMIAIRDATMELINLQLADCCDEELLDAQAHLALVYDPFVKKYGHVTERVNTLLFREDADYSVLAALEYTDEEDIIHKADIFTKRTIRTRAPIASCDTPDEALLVCLDQRAAVDIDFMAELCSLPPSEVIKQLEGRLIFKNPSSCTADDEWVAHDTYLSGNVRKKLSEAREAAVMDARFETNVEALENAVPPLIAFSDIYVNLGAPYIPPEVICSFVFEEIGKKKTPSTKRQITVKRDTHDKWRIRVSCCILMSDPYYYKEFGTEKYSAIWILEHLLNNTTIVATKKEKDSTGTEISVKDVETTLILSEKAQAIKAAFTAWLSRNPDKQTMIGALYNELYNHSSIPTYDGSHLTFPGMTACVELDDHQKNAVYRIIRDNGAYIAHVVGAGKTFTLLAAGMELKRLGRVNKPFYVVPNNLISQWVGELQRLYPSASILAADPDDMRGHRRKRMLSRIATGAYDAVIIGSSSFINVPPPYSVVQSAIEERSEWIQSSPFSDGHYSTFATNEEKKSMEESSVFFNRCVREPYTLADLGADFLFVDEAHEFKNLGARSSHGDVKGLPNTSSAKCLDMFYKTKYMSSLYGGKGGFVFASGTPYSNSIVEMYTVLRYYNEKALIDSGIFTLDQWLSTYAQITDEWEIPPEGLAEDGAGLRQVRRVSGFANLPELMAQALQFMDVVSRDDLKNIDTPTPIRKTVVALPSSEQKDYMQILVERANAIRANKSCKRVPSKSVFNDNMLLITVDGRKCALDARMVDNTARSHPEGKLDQCANQVAAYYREYDALKGTQLVFCEISASSRSTFHAYEALKALMVAKGIPAQEIAFAQEFDTPAKKRQMRIKMQCGKLRVLIGSTQSLGQGVNVQNRLIALHHLDVPWVPKDLEQREGRILRRGNMHTTVFIHSYVTEGSFNSYIWQLVETKARLIAQVMRGDHSQRTLEDSDTKVLSYAEIKAIATGNTAFLERAKIEGELTKLATLKRSYDASMETLRQNVYCNLPMTIESLNLLIPKMESDLAMFERNKVNPTIVIAGKTYPVIKKERQNINVALDGALRFAKPGDGIGAFLGFDMVLTKQYGWSFLSPTKTMTLQGSTSHKLDDFQVYTGRNALDCCIKVCQAMAGALQQKRAALASNETALNAAKSMLEEKFEHEDRIEHLKAELDRLTKEIAKCA